MTTERLPILRLVAIAAFAFAITFALNTLEPALLGHQALRLAAGHANSAIGFISAAGIVVAMITQPIVGTWSDRTRTRLGARLPFMIVGVLLEIGFLFLVAFAPTFWLLVAGVVGVQLASNVIQAPWQALYPDHVPEHQRGQAAALRAVFEIVSGLVGKLVAGELVGRVATWGRTALAASVAIPSLVLIVCLAVTAFFVPRTHVARAGETRDARNAVSPPPWTSNGPFLWWCANRFLFWNGFIAVTTFLLLYAIDVTGMTESAAQRYVGKVSFAIGIVLLSSLYPIGWISDRAGRRPIVIAAGFLAAAGTAVLLFTRNLGVIAGAACVVGLGIAMYLSADWAMITDIVPERDAARYLGIANVATTGGSVLARLAGGVLIDDVNRHAHSRSAGYLLTYAIAAAMFLASGLVATKLPGRRTEAV